MSRLIGNAKWLKIKITTFKSIYLVSDITLDVYVMKIIELLIFKTEKEER